MLANAMFQRILTNNCSRLLFLDYMPVVTGLRGCWDSPAPRIRVSMSWCLEAVRSMYVFTEKERILGISEVCKQSFLRKACAI